MSETNMSSEIFIEKAKSIIRNYVTEHLDKTDKVSEYNVFIVWYGYVLGNQKAIVSTTLPDGMYYEVAYSAEKHEIYLDAYKKFENRKVEV